MDYNFFLLKVGTLNKNLLNELIDFSNNQPFDTFDNTNFNRKRHTGISGIVYHDSNELFSKVLDEPFLDVFKNCELYCCKRM